jgi:hypothetical protein
MKALQCGRVTPHSEIFPDGAIFYSVSRELKDDADILRIKDLTPEQTGRNCTRLLLF